jgi:YD repeat-containing protein
MPSKITYPDLTNEQYTYNSDNEPLTHTDANGNTTTYTYDSHGNNTVIEDALGKLTTMTYTSLGQVQTSTDPNNHTTTYQYDSQGRLTTVTFSDRTTKLASYDSQGDVIKSTDALGHATTYSYSSFAATKVLSITALSEPTVGHPELVIIPERRRERFPRQARSEDPRGSPLLRSCDLARPSADGRPRVFLDLALFQADFPQSAAA